MDRKLAGTIGAVARAVRLGTGLTQAEVAERIGVVTEVYGRLERGLMLPSVGTLSKLSTALRTPAGRLLGLDDDTQPPPPPPEERQSPELRRLIRRVASLDRRTLRLLNMLVRALTR